MIRKVVAALRKIMRQGSRGQTAINLFVRLRSAVITTRVRLSNEDGRCQSERVKSTRCLFGERYVGPIRADSCAGIGRGQGGHEHDHRRGHGGFSFHRLFSLHVSLVEKRVCGGDERRVKTLTELIASARADISRAELHENFKRWKFGYVCNLTGGAAEIGQAATIGTTQGQTVGRCVGRFVARIKQQPRLASIPALYAKILCGSKALF